MATKTKQKVNLAKGRAAVEAERGPIMKFRVKEGIHYHGTKTWTKNMTLQSRLHLDKLFVNKFERVHDEVPADEGISDFKYKQKEMREASPKTPARKSISVEPESFEVDDSEPLVGDVEEEDLDAAYFEFFQGAADVTDEFEFVKEEAEGLKVLRNGKRFGVVSEENPRELLNKHQPLKRSEVNGFVEKFLDGEVESEE